MIITLPYTPWLAKIPHTWLVHYLTHDNYSTSPIMIITQQDFHLPFPWSDVHKHSTFQQSVGNQSTERNGSRTSAHSYTATCVYRDLQCPYNACIIFFRISHVFRRDNMNSCLYLCIWRMGRYWSECWYFPIVHNYLCNLLPLPCYMYIYIIVFGHNSSTKTSMFANSRHLMHKMCSNSSHVQLLIELIGMFQTWGG